MPLFVTSIDPIIKDTLENRQNFARMLDNSNYHTQHELTGMTKWYHQRQSFVRLISNAKIQNGSLTTNTYSEEYQGTSTSAYTGNNVNSDYSVTDTSGGAMPGKKITGTETKATYDSDIRNNWILTGGTEINNQMPSGFGQLYSSDRNVPLPGITEVNIQNKGSFGSTREAKIKYVCHTLEQLEMLEMLYMTFGVFCVLEWGWSVLPDGSHNLERITPEDMKAGLTVIEQSIKPKVDNSKGHYDAMMGKISGFNWTTREGGGYECETTLISMAGAFLSMDTKSSTRAFGVDSKDKTYLEPISNIEQAIKDLKNVIGKVNKGEAAFFDTDRKIPIGCKTDHRIDGNSEDQLYATWGVIEDYILTHSIGMISPNYLRDFSSTDTLKHYIEVLYSKDVLPAEPYTYENLYEIRASTEINAHIGAVQSPESLDGIYPHFNSFNTKIFNDPNIYSGDPTICILPGQAPVKIVPNSTAQTSFVPTNPGNDGYDIVGQISAQLNKFGNPDNVKQGYIRNICVNLDFIEKTYKDTNTVDEFVMSLLNEINYACGEPWKFSTFVDERLSNNISIVDLGAWSEKDPVPILISINGFDSIARSATLNTEVDARMQSQTMYGTNKEAKAQSTSSKIEGFGFWGRNVVDQNFENSTPVDTDILEVEPARKIVDNTLDGLLATIEATKKAVTTSRSEETVSAAKQALHNYLVRTSGGVDSESDTQPTFTTMLPVKLAVTMDGLSGLIFGNALRAKPIPRRYGDCWFTITNVNHTLTGNDWSTAIETVLRVRLPKDQSTVASEISKPKTADTSTPTESSKEDVLAGPYSTIKDKNPWNIRPGKNKWSGEIGKKSHYQNGNPTNRFFVVFDTLNNGIRAGMKTLNSYFITRRLNTVQDIIWTYTGFGAYIKTPDKAPATIPGGDGQTLANTKLYTQNVVNWLNANWKKGITKDTKLNFNGRAETNAENIKMFKEFNKIIVKIEHSSSYTPEFITAINNFNISLL